MTQFDKLYSDAVQDSNTTFEKTFNHIDGIESLLTHSGHNPMSLPDMGNPVIPPITLSTTFQQVEPATGKVTI